MLSDFEIKELQAELKASALRKQDLQADVSKARAMLQNAKRGTVGAVRKGISQASSALNDLNRQEAALSTQIKQNQERIKKLKLQMKEMDGPASKAFDEALRVLNIQLTIYFSGEFVGPQISKLAQDHCWKGVTDHVHNTLDKLRADNHISQDQHLKGRALFFVRVTSTSI